MRKAWRGVAAVGLTATFVLGGKTVSISNAASTPPPTALAYVSNGQVAVIEAGNLTTVGVGQNPVWSPNGANLLYVTADLLGNTADIYVADTHGAGSKRVMSHAYPFITPGWSPDSKYILFTAVASGTSAGGSTTRLEVRAMRLADGKVRALGQFTFTSGCSLTSTALQAAATKAQGSYHGMPSTLIWAQPTTVIVQSSCTGQGLTAFSVGSNKPTVLKNWSAGVLSPDGKTVAAVVTPAGKNGSAQVGLLTQTTGKQQILGPKLAAGSVSWSLDGKTIYVAGQPSNTQTGFAHLYRLSKDGKTVSSLGQIQAAGLYHLSVDHTGKSLAMAVVASAATNIAAPPQTLVYDVATSTAGQAHPIIAGGEPAWRP